MCHVVSFGHFASYFTQQDFAIYFCKEKTWQRLCESWQSCRRYFTKQLPAMLRTGFTNEAVTIISGNIRPGAFDAERKGKCLHFFFKKGAHLVHSVPVRGIGRGRGMWGVVPDVLRQLGLERLKGGDSCLFCWEYFNWL